MAHPLDRVLGSVVIDKLEADYQRVSLSKIFRGLAQDVAFFAQLCVFFCLTGGFAQNHSPLGLYHARL